MEQHYLTVEQIKAVQEQFTQKVLITLCGTIERKQEQILIDMG